MKKRVVFLVLFLWSICQPRVTLADELIDITRAAGYTDISEVFRPKSSIVIDAKTGDVLWEDNADELRDPASLSKVMTLYLVFEAMASGQFTAETVVTATPTDQAISEIYAISNNKIIAGVDYSVSELITATVVPSSNVATLMLSRLVEADPDAFIDRMNAKAQELGMTNSKFYNSGGAAATAFQGYYSPSRYDNSQVNQATARDYAILTYRFLNNFPDILTYTAAINPTIKAGTPYEETFSSHHYSLPGMTYGLEGMTGLKTGSSPSAGFNLIATAQRSDQSVIAVTMGSGDWSDQSGEQGRHPFVNALVEKAFADYDYKLLLDAGKQTVSGKEVELETPVYGTVTVGGEEPQLVYEDGRVRVDNGLSKVSPLLLEEQAVKASEVAPPVEQGTTSKSSHLITLLLSLGGGILIILLGLIVLKRKGKN